MAGLAPVPVVGQIWLTRREQKRLLVRRIQRAPNQTATLSQTGIGVRCSSTEYHGAGLGELGWEEAPSNWYLVEPVMVENAWVFKGFWTNRSESTRPAGEDLTTLLYCPTWNPR
jgi:hypothetical protein